MREGHKDKGGVLGRLLRRALKKIKGDNKMANVEEKDKEKHKGGVLAVLRRLLRRVLKKGNDKD